MTKCQKIIKMKRNDKIQGKEKNEGLRGDSNEDK